MTWAQWHDLPPPELDTWASPDMHVLPHYLQDFWKDMLNIPTSTVIWCNPRFSQLSKVLALWQQLGFCGYLLFPHWPDSPWWGDLAPMLDPDLVLDFPAGTRAFCSLQQTHPQPVPWPFHVAWLDLSSTRPNASSLAATPSGGRSHVGKSRRGRARRARQLRLLHISSYPPMMGAYQVPPMSRMPRPPAQNCDKPLGKVAHPLSLQALLRTAQQISFPELPTLKSMYDCLTHRKHFVKLFSESSMAQQGVPSRLSPDRLQEAIQYGLLSPVPRTQPIYFFHSNFLVPKSDGLHSRLISNITFNDQQPAPPMDWKCELPSIPQMLHTVLSWNFATELDARSFFPQFPLGVTVQPFFGLRQSHFRGVLLVMPQGWTWAPAIAQTTARMLTHKLPIPADDIIAAAFAWMDNFIMGASTMKIAQAMLDAFVARCDACQVTLKDPPDSPSRHITALGVEYDLCQHRYRLAPDWAAEAASFVSALVIELRTGHMTSLRTIWQAIGTCMWCANIHMLLLGTHMWSILRFMKTHTPKEQSRTAWEVLYTMPQAPLDEMASLVDRLHTNPWLPQPCIPPSIRQVLRGFMLITDASLWAGAYLVAASVTSPFQGQWWQWAPQARRDNMPMLEALALLRALQELQPYLRTGQIVPWFTDCDPARRAVKKGYSASPPLNSIVTAIRAFDVLLMPSWIPTLLNPADPYSRRRDFVPPFTTIDICLQDTALWPYIIDPRYKGVPPPRKRG